MEGRSWVVILTLIIPAILIGITVVAFAINPLSILVLLTIMVGGVLYLQTYTEAV